jgi:hypothetical protein
MGVFKLRIHAASIAALAALFLFPQPSKASEANTLTLINKTSEDALVKLVGPSKRSVMVPVKTEQTLHIAGGKYVIYVRYGNAPGRYRYSKGEEFEIEETANTYTEAFLTLHGVADGNYATESVPASEFDKVQVPGESEQRR